MIVDTFLECCLRLLHTNHSNSDRIEELTKVISTLELLTANLAVALIFLHKYQSNSVNSLDINDCDSMAYYGIVAALVLANKFINDQSYTLKTWHNILSKFLLFQAPLSMLNQLEMNFLAGLDYMLNTKHDPLMWTELDGLNAIDTAQLRLAVDPSCPSPISAGSMLSGPVCPAPTYPTVSSIIPTVMTPIPMGASCAPIPFGALQLPSHFELQLSNLAESVASARLSVQGSLRGSVYGIHGVNPPLREATDLTYLSHNSTPMFAPVTPLSHLFAIATLPTPFTQVGATPYKWEQPCKRRKMWNEPPTLAYLTN
ncbi:CIC11C00000004557 [Sungouiella intermedia]|uniref:CIC11C00000004557 n=1 Tax=Sungouiella intermedia TaxID=45354 RepID=A0A1L0BK83_9ASCO|nr:CIC11C00000004557 [[Candida] intermedia]